MLGAVLIEKEVCSSTNYLTLIAKLESRTLDEKLLRALFESRIKNRLVSTLTQETVASVRASPTSVEALPILISNVNLTQLEEAEAATTTYHDELIA